jgi:hypothetical protein
MSDELFNVVFRGDIVPGQGLPDVKLRFAQVFRLEADKVDGYFSGKPIVLKKDCDRATADKFKAVLQQAGAMVDIKSANAPAPAPRPVPVKPSAPTQSAPAVAPVSAAPVSVSAFSSTVEDETWSLSSRGSDLLKAEERIVPAPVQVSIEHIQLVKRNPFAMDAEEPLEHERDMTPPQLDLSSLQLAQVGSTLADYQEFKPRELDLSALSLDALGADLVREDEQMPMMGVELDISDINLAPAGGELGQLQAPPPPPAPATDHLTFEK